MNKLLLAALLLVPTLAIAEPTTPDGWYSEGDTQYNLGNFDAAAAAFKKGFELETDASKRPAYLFNVAQSYRQAKNCTDAQFFYKRYLALKDQDTAKPLAEKKRQEIEKIIADLDDCAKQQAALVVKPPTSDPDGTKAKPVEVATVQPQTKVVVVETAPAAEHPHLLSLRALGGGSVINAGDLSVPVQGAFGLLAGYPLALGEKLTLDLGAAVFYAQTPYETPKGEKGTGTLTTLLADVGATYAVAERIGLRVDVGVGVLLMGGVSNSPFTAEMPADGSLSMLAVRGAVSADFGVTPNVLITATPFAFGYSPAADGLRKDIGSITRIDFMIGLGYRM